eukprot:7440895-Ditylum_brightwellii.AAC.1
MAFISPSTMTITCRCDIFGLPGSFSNMTSIAVCHHRGEKPRRKGKTIIVAWTRLVLSDNSAVR